MWFIPGISWQKIGLYREVYLLLSEHEGVKISFKRVNLIKPIQKNEWKWLQNEWKWLEKSVASIVRYHFHYYYKHINDPSKSRWLQKMKALLFWSHFHSFWIALLWSGLRVEFSPLGEWDFHSFTFRVYILLIETHQRWMLFMKMRRPFNLLDYFVTLLLYWLFPPPSSAPPLPISQLTSLPPSLLPPSLPPSLPSPLTWSLPLHFLPISSDLFTANPHMESVLNKCCN